MAIDKIYLLRRSRGKAGYKGDRNKKGALLAMVDHGWAFWHNSFVLSDEYGAVEYWNGLLGKFLRTELEF